jgi:hypothetical protein
VISAWEFNGPGTPTLPVLVVEDPDGNRTNGYAPDDVIIDLTTVTEPGDMAVFYREQHQLRAAKDKEGHWQWKRFRGDMEIPCTFSVIVATRRVRARIARGKEQP